MDDCGGIVTQGSFNEEHKLPRWLRDGTVMVLALIAATLVAATLGVRSSQERSSFATLVRDSTFLQSSPTFSTGITLTEGQIHLPSALSSHLEATCHALGVSLTVLPAGSGVPLAGPLPPIVPNGQAQSPTTGSSTLLTGFERPPSSISFCQGFAPSGSGSYSVKYFIRPSKKDIAIYELGVAVPAFTTSLLATIREIPWILLIVVIIVSLGLWRIQSFTRRETFGLTSDALRGLLQEHQALLKGISDGVVGCDTDGVIQFANEEARRLLRLPTTCIGRPLAHLVRGRRLREVLGGEIHGRDLPVVVGNAILSISRLDVEHDGHTLGFVITIQDRTEWESLMRELDGMVGMTDALRAQAHEFSNRLHTIVGLIELGKPDEAVGVAVNLSARRWLPSSTLDNVYDPMIKALLLAKSAVASEKGVSLHVAEDTMLSGSLQHPIDVLTVVGNLIDNAIDAVLDATAMPLLNALDSTEERGWILLRITSIGDDLTIEVRDSGRGVDPEIENSIFIDGFSTKASSRGTRRGLGLAMIAQIVAKYNGSTKVVSDPGAFFTIVLPGALISDADRDVPYLAQTSTSTQDLRTEPGNLDMPTTVTVSQNIHDTHLTASTQTSKVAP